MPGEIIKIDEYTVKKLDNDMDEEADKDKQHVFIIGSKGIPAAYGGFETFVEKLTERRKSDKILYHVSRIAGDNNRYEYNNARCFNVKVPDIGAAKAVYYDLAAIKRCIKYCKKRPYIKKPIFYILACRIGPFIGKYKKQIEKLGGTLYVNPDGHEWKRAKWNRLIRKYWKQSERGMLKHADYVVCDSKCIEKYILRDYAELDLSTFFIAYGSDTAPSELSDNDSLFTEWLTRKGLVSGEYYLAVGRFVPENNYETMIREFMKSKTNRSLALITNVNDRFLSELENKLHYKSDTRIKFVGTVYEQKLLKKIRENACGYLHGHEVGGTNPSLLEALGSTKLNLLYDVSFNREVADDAALYWTKDDNSLSELINSIDTMDSAEIEELGKKARHRVQSEYSWSHIVDEYESLFLDRKKSDK